MADATEVEALNWTAIETVMERAHGEGDLAFGMYVYWFLARISLRMAAEIDHDGGDAGNRLLQGVVRLLQEGPGPGDPS